MGGGLGAVLKLYFHISEITSVRIFSKPLLFYFYPTIFSEGKSLASSFDTKFIETSSGIQHNVDELLVGVLKQIRLKGERGSDDEETRLIRKKSSKKKRKSGCRRSGSFKIPGMQLLDKVLCHDAKSKSCEDLHVL